MNIVTWEQVLSLKHIKSEDGLIDYDVADWIFQIANGYITREGIISWIQKETSDGANN